MIIGMVAMAVATMMEIINMVGKGGDLDGFNTVYKEIHRTK